MRRAWTRRRAAAAALALTAAVPLLGGCGIQETDVIEAGGPASVQAALNREYDMLLFFSSPDGGMSPVIRTPATSSVFDGYVEAGSEGDTAGQVPTEKVVLELLDGPQEQDRAAGLSTSLPAALPGATVEVELSPAGKVTARLPIALEGLSSTALRQLTCTIAYSQDTDGQAVVQLTGQDGVSTSGTCALTPDSTSNDPTEPEARTPTTPSGTTG